MLDVHLNTLYFLIREQNKKMQKRMSNRKTTAILSGLLLACLGTADCKDILYNTKIVNGTDADPGRYPYMVSLQFLGFHMCGGTIVNSKYILTAAHCVHGWSTGGMSALTGTVTLHSGGVRHAVEAVIEHEHYSAENNSLHDVALVQVKDEIIFNDFVKPVALPSPMEITAVGTTATVIGWGFPHSRAWFMDHLQQVNITVYSDEECQSIHDNPPHDSNICAGDPNGGRGQCSGDSGGPLLANDHQVGIVSWSVKPCAVAPYPGVFTEVAYYVDWIRQHTVS